MKREPTEDATESENLRMDGHSLRGNRECPQWLPLATSRRDGSEKAARVMPCVRHVRR